MRIAWFTPFVQDSAIGMVGKSICEELTKTIDVDIWMPKAENKIPTTVNVVEFNSQNDLSELRDYDYLIYNMGNFAGNHREIYDVSLRYPGVVICHDQTMGNFFGQYYTFPEFGGDNSDAGYDAYASFLKKYSTGSIAEEMYEGKRKDYFPIYEYGTISSCRLLEPVLENSIGFFTHAEFFCREIKKIYNKPMSYSYLPCKVENKAECEDKDIIEIIKKAKKANKKILVSNGIVHHVKQIDKVVEVLVNNTDLSSKVVYIVIGGYGGEYGNRLAEIAENSLKGCLFMMNYQTYDVMNYALSNADMCINLRYPNSEVCSLSLLEQMSFEKPVLVINSGIYGEMPDNAVIKINYANLCQGIKEKLQLLIDGTDFSDYGKNAEKFIESQCTAAVYCKKFISFLNSFDKEKAIKELQNKTLNLLCEEMHELNINDVSVPSTVNRTVYEMNGILNSDVTKRDPVKTIGVWCAFYYEIPNLAREGISRFMGNMISSIVKRYQVNVEAWCYSFNEEELRKTFLDVPSDKIKFITEKNWMDTLNIGADIADMAGEIRAERDNLNVAARMASKADIMLPLIIYLDSVIGTDKKIFVPAHDMAVAYHFDEFVTNDKNYKFRNSDIIARAENLARNNAFFLTISDSVRQKQILKFIRSLNADKTEYVYLPVMIPSDIEKKTLSEKEIREKFAIDGKYLFYPTQIRPYKNFQLLFKTIDLLKQKGTDITLVITGNPKDVPEVNEIFENLEARDNVIRLNSITESELYSLYKYADAVPVPSLFEGGFPLQACEALFMNTPVVLADIDVVRERIEAYGFSIDDCGLRIFDPYNEIELADRLEEVLSDRENAVKAQRKFADVLLNYTWEDAAEHYYRIFCEK